MRQDSALVATECTSRYVSRLLPLLRMHAGGGGAPGGTILAPSSNGGCCCQNRLLCCACMQAAVVGLAARGDVLASLEKRVKSRFSHRRSLLLELDAAEFEHPQSGVPALLRAQLRLPVRLP